MEDEEKTSTEQGLRYLRSVFLNIQPEESNVEEEDSVEEIIEEPVESFDVECEKKEDEEIPNEVSLSDLLSKTLDIQEDLKESPIIIEKQEDQRWKIKCTVPSPSLGVLVNDMVDKWNEISLPFIPSSVSIFKDAFIATEKEKKPKWLPINLLAHLKSTWSNGKWKADQVITNDSILVRWDNFVAYLLTTDISPSNSQWMKMSTKKVYGVALNSKDAWMIVDGGVDLLLGIPNDSIHHHLECEFKLVSISVKDDAAWAVSDEGSLIVRVGYTKNRRFGEDWIELRPDGPTSVISISIFKESGFILDDTYSLWRADCVNEYNPFGKGFYRVGSPLDAISYGSITPTPVLSVSNKGIFLSKGKRLIYSSSPLSGHRFVSQISSSLSSLDDFSLLSAGFHSMDHDSMGVIVQLRSTGEMFSFRPQISFSLHPFPFTTDLQSIEKISLITSCTTRSILSDSSGNFVYIVEGIAASSSFTYEIETIAVSEVSTWIATRDGKVLVSQNFPPDQWKEVPFDGKVEKIFVSPNGRYVWIVSGGKGWVREGIRMTNQIGGRWIMNESCPPLVSLAVGNSIVYALSQEGKLFRLRALSAVNVKGGDWALISPVHFFSSISLDSNSSLWMLTREGKLHKHEISIYRPQ
ncbi:hypothetical protein PRIPAC_72873 [Pristionchus pacificus]|nr:hypothetical protein PRIPAC_72873 [Pristionchus pacificus]